MIPTFKKTPAKDRLPEKSNFCCLPGRAGGFPRSNKHFAKLADTLDAHRPGLLADFRHWISTAKMEGTNNKIKVLKRQAYGFRDMAFFKLRLYFLHERSIMMPG